MRRAVFLDRDGVINRSLVKDGRPYAPIALIDFEILPGVVEALLQLRQAGYLNIVVTNQPDVKTGKQSTEVLRLMHARLVSELALDDIQVCPHSDEDGCSCRKPGPGMLIEAAGRHQIRLSESWMIGDRWRDIAAGQAAGCRCFFVDHGYAERQPEQPFNCVASLPEAVAVIVGQT
ncbi:MAG: HAD family hydrolase [Gammaproteobacteria bacterium]|nr:HAD family hydrolase [Gammaproteobacteria bacterium]